MRTALRGRDAGAGGRPGRGAAPDDTGWCAGRGVERDVVRDGEPLEPEAELADLPEPEPTPWWEDAWETVEIAGDPPTRVDPPPARRIDDAEGAPEEE